MSASYTKDVVLEGRHVRLEPLEESHVSALVEAALVAPSLYQWTVVPQDKDSMANYVGAAIEWRDAGTGVPFAIVRRADNAVIGSTRFFELEAWDWPVGHPRHRCGLPDAGQIGYTWFTRSAIRTGANTEAKFLMLRHAFDCWQTLRICLNTDSRNQRSRAAIERIGGKFEGVIRAHKLAPDFAVRDSLRFSIIAAEWPEVKQKLIALLDRSARHAAS